MSSSRLKNYYLLKKLYVRTANRDVKWTNHIKLSNIQAMDKFTATQAKQRFGELLERASAAPVTIEKHGKVVAAMVPADWLSRDSGRDERQLARERQNLLEERRLMAHQRIGLDLLARAEGRQDLLNAARQEVARWSDLSLCSQDYIDRWGEWLSLPADELALRMCSDAGGWGKAMRQNSPFIAVAA